MPVKRVARKPPQSRRPRRTVLANEPLFEEEDPLLSEEFEESEYEEEEDNDPDEILQQQPVVQPPPDENLEEQLDEDINLVNTRLNMLNKCMLELPPQRHALIRDMGLGVFLDLNVLGTIDRRFCMWLYKKFDPDQNALVFDDGTELRVRPNHVATILGLPRDGRVVPTSVDQLLSLDEHIMYDRFNIKYEFNQGILPAVLSRALIKGNLGDDEFRLVFLHYVLGTVLCPTQAQRISPALLAAAIAGFRNFKDFAWSQFVYDWLIEAGRRFHEQKTRKPKPGAKKKVGVRGAGGCALIFLILYLDNKPLPNRVDWYRQPRILAWNEASIYSSMVSDYKGNGEFGEMRFVHNIWYGSGHPSEQLHRRYGDTHMPVMLSQTSARDATISDSPKGKLPRKRRIGAVEIGRNAPRAMTHPLANVHANADANANVNASANAPKCSRPPKGKGKRKDPEYCADSRPVVVGITASGFQRQSSKKVYVGECSTMNTVRQARARAHLSDLHSEGEGEDTDVGVNDDILITGSSGVTKTSKQERVAKRAAEIVAVRARLKAEEKAKAEKEKAEKEKKEKEKADKEKADKEKAAALESARRSLEIDNQFIAKILAEKKAEESRRLEEEAERLADEMEKAEREAQDMVNADGEVMQVDSSDDGVVYEDADAQADNMDDQGEDEDDQPEPVINMNVNVNEMMASQELGWDDLEDITKLSQRIMSDAGEHSYTAPHQTVQPKHNDTLQRLSSYTSDPIIRTPAGNFLPWKPKKRVEDLIQFITTYKPHPRVHPRAGTRGVPAEAKDKDPKLDAVVVEGMFMYVHDVRDNFCPRLRVRSDLVRTVTKLHNRKWGGQRFMFSPDHMASAFVYDVDDKKVFSATHVTFVDSFRKLRASACHLDLNVCQVFFFPIVFENHWFCYVFDAGERKICLLDSIYAMDSHFHSHIRGEMVALFVGLLNSLQHGHGEMVRSWATDLTRIPIQDDTASCGIMMLLGIYLWDRGVPSTAEVSWYFKYCRPVFMSLLCLDEYNEAADKLQDLADTAAMEKRRNKRGRPTASLG